MENINIILSKESEDGISEIRLVAEGETMSTKDKLLSFYRRYKLTIIVVAIVVVGVFLAAV